MYLSSMNENVSRNTPAYVFEIQQLFLHENLPVGTEYAMVAVADGLTKRPDLRTTLGRTLREIIHRESGRINAMELLSLILTASASPVEPLPSDRMERAMHETLGFILEVRQHLEDPNEVNPGAEMIGGSRRLRSWPEPLISRGPLEKFSLSKRAMLVIALCGLLLGSLVVGLSRRRNQAVENAVIQRRILPTSGSENRPDSIAPGVSASRVKIQTAENGMHRPKAGVQRSQVYEAQTTPPSYTAPPVAVRTPLFPTRESGTNSASASTNSGMPSVSHSTTHANENLAGSTQPRPAVTAAVSTPVVAPAISAAVRKAVNPSSGSVRSGSAGIMAANLIWSPTPAYPTAASKAKVEGEVTVNALVGKDGNVLSATVVSGPPLLREAALNAVERWQYHPYLISGKPAVMATTAIIEFELAHD